ncbi:SEC14-like protein 1 [Fragariocoptes setiger]|uniref:SEC14-like protein 1 n=1 Tax=Fragariocoptes setiger TaxID=1670756 RepID=A0ABQ7SD30_9ACAR|nr:SEC14-like protein 1 [Fragariocoptes setiger]
MVQKYKSPVWVYKYPFELVMAAYERRFPSCELIPVFVGSDILREEISPDQSIHIVERRCKINVDAPYILKKLAGVDYVYFIQINTLNKLERKLTIKANNESFANRITINEYCTYSTHPDNPDWTCFEQSACLEVKSFFGFETTVEKLAAKQYAQSISKGREIIEYYIQKLKNEGITHVPRFKLPDNTPTSTSTTTTTTTITNTTNNSTSNKPTNDTRTISSPLNNSNYLIE